MKVRFSIITVSYNAEETIKDTINSVLSQTFEDFEIVVKDGLSTDNTISMIPKDRRILLISQKDNGIYDAMNQAIEASQGEYLIFMNCGDTFDSSDVLLNVDKFISENPGIDIIYGNYVVNGDVRIQPKILTDFYLFRTPLCHQSMIIKKELFDEIGFYDLRYRILADYNFTQKAWWNGKKFEYIDLVVCKYLGGGVSEMKEGMRKKEIERKEILKKYYPKWLKIKYDFILLISLRKARIWLMTGNSPNSLRNLYKCISNCLNS